MSIVFGNNKKRGEAVKQNTTTASKCIINTPPSLSHVIPDKANLALHRAVWQNDRKSVIRLLNKVDPNATELESGWTALHKAFYLGNLRIASILIANGASYEKRDKKNRTPLDLISRELKMPDESNCNSDVYGYGCGSNYQLGIGSNEDAHEVKCLTVLSDKLICDISVSKYHGMALTRDGDVYSWGWNRGGRLGHLELETNKGGEGMGVQLFPKLISVFSKIRVVSISAAKNHSLAVTDLGELYSWGSDRDGKLGYLLTGKHWKVPRKINLLKSIFVTKAVAANRHSVIITDTGSVFTWGSNKYGQLGYGTSDSVSNHRPHLVEFIHHKEVIHISASKRHTIAVMTDGEVFTWGNKCVTPRQIILAGCRDKYLKTSTGREIYIHRGKTKTKRPLAVMAAAGVQRSFCLTSTGTVLFWDNQDPSIVKEIKGNLKDKNVTWISASKSYFGLCTNIGDVYIVDNQEFDVDVQMKSVEKMKNCAKVVTGESHYMFLQNWDTSYLKHLSEKGSAATNQSHSVKSMREDNSEIVSESALSVSNEISFNQHQMKTPFEIDLDLIDNNNFELIMTQSEKMSDLQKNTFALFNTLSITISEGSGIEVPSLQRICEKVVSMLLLRPSNVLYIYQLADGANLTYLKRNCLRMVISNLALVLNVMGNEISNISQNVLFEIEKKYKTSILGMTLSEVQEQKLWYFSKLDEKGEIIKDNEKISHKYGSRPTSYPTLIQIEGVEDFELFEVTTTTTTSSSSDPSQTGKVQNKFRPDHKLPEFIEIEKIKNSMVRKLEQIETLVKKESQGLYLDNHQINKIKKKTCFKNVLNAIALGSDLNTIKKILNTDVNQNEESILTCKSKKKKKKKNESSSDPKMSSKKKSISQDDESYLKPWKHQMNVTTQDNSMKNVSSSSIIKKKTLTEDEFPKIESIKTKLTKNEIKNQEIKRGALILTKSQIEPIKKSTNTKNSKSKNASKKTSLKDLLTKTPEEIRQSIENSQEPVSHNLKTTQAQSNVPVWGKVSKDQNKTQMMSILDIQEEEELSKHGMVSLIKKDEEVVLKGARRPATVKMDPKSKWYVPNAVLVQSIPALQVEERAMEEISHLYGPNAKVRVVEGTARGTFKQS